MKDSPPDNATRMRELSTAQGFEKSYYTNLRVCKTQTDAYEMTETEYVNLFGQRKYSNYNSFRNVINRRIR